MNAEVKTLDQLTKELNASNKEIKRLKAKQEILGRLNEDDSDKLEILVENAVELTEQVEDARIAHQKHQVERREQVKAEQEKELFETAKNYAEEFQLPEFASTGTRLRVYTMIAQGIQNALAFGNGYKQSLEVQIREQAHAANGWESRNVHVPIDGSEAKVNPDLTDKLDRVNEERREMGIMRKVVEYLYNQEINDVPEDLYIPRLYRETDEAVLSRIDQRRQDKWDEQQRQRSELRKQAKQYANADELAFFNV